MKRLVIAAAFFLMSLCFGESLSAQNFAVLGGANIYTTDITKINSGPKIQWHFGFAYKFDLPKGFEFQPALLYNVKGANFNLSDTDLSVGYIELMTSVQWGIDLILFKPFIEVSPFVGYGLNGMGGMKALWKECGNRLEYGVGLGGGLQIWRFQLSARHNWNIGGIMKDMAGSEILEGADFNGTTLSIAYFF